ncbi:MCE family protein [Rhodococcus aerolatus]
MTRRRARSLLGVAAAGTSVALLASGCGGLYGVTLPGGADVGSDPLKVTVEFADALDLVPQSSVKVDNVDVGRVDSVDLGPDQFTALVTVEVNNSVQLPANATASIVQTSLLGEKYVALAPPTGEAPQGTLSTGATIPKDRTSRGAEIEEVLGALSLLVNGGGVGQLQTVLKEINTAVSGREGDIRSLLDQANTLISGLNDQRTEINRALDSLDTLNTTILAQRADLTTALDDLPAGIAVLRDQRPQLVELLRQLDRLGQVGTTVINGSRDALVADLQSLLPTLRSLVDAGDALPQSLQILLTYPFADSAIPVVKGGYFNLVLNADLQLGSLINGLGINTGAVSAPSSASPPVPLPNGAGA